MISPTTPMNEFSNSETEYGAQAERCARLNPGTSLLVALGVGLAVGVLVHALRPAPKPQQRLARLLQDMEESLREVSAPALDRVGSLAADGAHVLGDRLHRSEAQVEKFLRTAANRLRRLTS
jgi:ElaB/YqjD/DUF883 family membrane-anchored ribosome-binding protein